jgi:hypothetical protein
MNIRPVWRRSTAIQSRLRISYSFGNELNTFNGTEMLKGGSKRLIVFANRLGYLRGSMFIMEPDEQGKEHSALIRKIRHLSLESGVMFVEESCLCH